MMKLMLKKDTVMLNMWEISKSLLSLIVAPHGFVCFSSEPSKEEIITHCYIYMVLVGMYLKRVFM
jgi:putative exporter of polyketide antibiotics